MHCPPCPLPSPPNRKRKLLLYSPTGGRFSPYPVMTPTNEKHYHSFNESVNILNSCLSFKVTPPSFLPFLYKVTFLPFVRFAYGFA